MSRLGVMVDDLGPSQLARALILAANARVAADPLADVVVFYQRLAAPCVTPAFACMPVAEGWGYDAPVVATTLATAAQLARMPACPARAFYVWDLEWVRRPARPFRELLAVYADPRLALAVRGEDHARAVEDAWGRRPAVVPDFDLDALAEVARGVAG